MSEVQGQRSVPAVERVEVSTLSFEQAQAELEQVVEQLEDQRTGLDEALGLWERGEALHAWCQGRLDHAAERMQRIVLGPEEVAAVVAESGDEFTAEPDATGVADVVEPAGVPGPDAPPAVEAEQPRTSTTPATADGMPSIF